MGLISDIGQELGNAIQEEVTSQYRNIKHRLEKVEKDTARLETRNDGYGELHERIAALEASDADDDKHWTASDLAFYNELTDRVGNVERVVERLRQTIDRCDSSLLHNTIGPSQFDELTKRVDELAKYHPALVEGLQSRVAKLETLYNSSKIADIREAHARLDLAFESISKFHPRFEKLEHSGFRTGDHAQLQEVDRRVEKIEALPLVQWALNGGHATPEVTSWEEAAEQLNQAKPGIAAGREQCAAQLEQWLNNATGRHYLGFAQSSLADELRNLIHQWRNDAK